MGAGGEIGIYNGTGDVVNTTMSEHLGITMSMEVLANYDRYAKDWSNIANASELKHNENVSIVNYQPEGESWWITGWNQNEQIYKDTDLTLKGTLDFSANDKTRKMYNELKSSYSNQKKYDLIKGNMIFNDGYIVDYIW